MKRFLPLLLAGLLAMFAIAGPVAAASPTASNVTAPVTGTSNGLTFNGSLDITRFAVQRGQLVVIGDLTGTVTNAAGTVLGTVTDLPVTLPVLGGSSSGASCEILDLVLGPLDLNLLGLVVHLDTVHLNITAVPGPGNLLGNLLCAVAGLLDGNAALSSLAGLLNQILAILG